MIRSVARVVLLVSVVLPAACGRAATPTTDPASHQPVAIYLTSRDVPAAELATVDVRSLQLREPPLVTSADMITYDPATHEIELTPEAYARVQQVFRLPVDVDGVPFVVTVGRQPIYAGALWTPLSSLSFDGVVIMQPLEEAPPIIRLDRGYPASDFARGRDPRSDARVLSSLAAEGKLKQGAE